MISATVSVTSLTLSLHRRGIGNEAMTEHRLLIRRRRQFPGAGRRRAHLGVDMHVEQERLVGLDRMVERAAEILRLGHGERIDTGRFRPGGKVRIEWLLAVALVEHGAVFA